MNVLPFAVLLVAATSPVGRDPDSPQLAATKERQKKAKTFEVVLSVKKEWQGVAQYQSAERKDFSAAGTIKLVVDGYRYWYSSDVPTLNGMRDRVVRQRTEFAFDGGAAYTRHEFEVLKGEHAGQLAPLVQVIASGGHGNWRQAAEAAQPLGWLLHGFDRTLEQADADENTDTTDGVRCERYRIPPSSPGNPTTVWFDPHAGHVPRRVETNAGKHVTRLTYPTSGTPGWVPTGWVTTARSNPARMVTETTTVTVESFAVRESIPASRFAVNFPVGSRVERPEGDRVTTHTVAEDGSLVEVGSPEATGPTFSPPSLGFTLSVVGTTLAVFVALAALLRWMTRDSPRDGRITPT